MAMGDFGYDCAKEPDPEPPSLAMRHTAVLLISCPDRKGLVATIAEFLIAITPTSCMPTSIRTARTSYF